MEQKKISEQFYITPRKLHRGRKLPYVFDFAIMCFCPQPLIFKKYIMSEELNKYEFSYVSDGDVRKVLREKSQPRYFSHVNNNNILYCTHKDQNFIVLSEIYGSGAPTSATLEELQMYGINKVIGVGFVGSMNKYLLVGMNVFASKSFIREGMKLDCEYLTDKNLMFASPSSNNSDDFLDRYLGLDPLPATFWETVDFYRETKSAAEVAKEKGCDVVNLETSYFYIVANALGMNVSYYATVSDMLKIEEDETKWDNLLDDALNDPEKSIIMMKQNELVEALIKSHTTNMFFQMDIYKLRLKKLLYNNNICQSHDFAHAETVYENARNALICIDSELEFFGKLPPKNDVIDLSKIPKKTIVSYRISQMILLAALLHDVDDRKFFPKNLNNENVKKILYDKSSDFVTHVIEMINLVSSSSNGDSMTDEVWKLYPRYADRIEALGILGVERCYQFTLTIKNPLILSSTPRPKTVEDVWKIATKERYAGYKGKSVSMIDHYYDKLLRLGFFPEINEWLSTEATKRIDVMVRFVLEFCNRDDTGNNEADNKFISKFLYCNKI